MAKVLSVGSGSGVVGISATVYFHTYNTQLTSLATENHAQRTMQDAGTISNIFCLIQTNGTSANSTFRIRINAANGNTLITIGAGATGEFEDNTNVDVVAIGDEVNYRVVGAASGGLTFGVMSCVFNANNGSVQIIGSGRGFDLTTASVTQFWGFVRVGNNGDATESTQQLKITVPGTAKNALFRVISNARTTTTTFGSRKNTAAGNITASAGAGVTGFIEDTTNSDALAVGDLYNFTHTTGTGTELLHMSYSVSVYTLNGEFFLTTLPASGIAPSAGSTTYYAFGGNSGSTTEASNHSDANLNLTGRHLWVRVSANATTGTSTVKSRVNSADGKLLVSIGAAATGEFEDATNVDTISESDDIDVQFINGGGGTLTLRASSEVFKHLSGNPTLLYMGVG